MGDSAAMTSENDGRPLRRRSFVHPRLSRRRKRSAHYDRLTQYGNRCDWLKDDKFLRDLEGDSVDTEILDEELRSLSEDEPKTCRGKSVKCLESNPFNIVLCVLVLIDAGVVLAEILLDLHAIRGQYKQTQKELDSVLDFIRYAHTDELHGYHGSDVTYILDLLGDYDSANVTQAGHRRRRQAEPPGGTLEELTMQMLPSLYEALEQILQHPESGPPIAPYRGRSTTAGYPSTGTDAAEGLAKSFSLWQQAEDSVGLRADLTRLYEGISRLGGDEHAREEYDSARRRREAGNTDVNNNNNNDDSNNAGDDTDGTVNTKADHAHVVSYAQNPTKDPEGGVSVEHGARHNNINNRSHGNATVRVHPADHHGGHGNAHTDAERLLEIAHYLHYCSIGILGIFVIQLFLKLYGMGMEFFRKKMEIFDAVIILASFALDLVFLEGIGGAKGEEAAALLIVFLLWRILRVINGIMVTAKKRQEFRIKLQKRARRRAEKKVEILEEEKGLRDKEISALKELCTQMGAHEDDIAACKPRRKSKGILSRLDTSVGLTSVASLSLSLSMSMSGGVLNMARSNPIIARRDSSQPRRISMAPGGPMFANHIKGAPVLARPAPAMEKVVEESGAAEASKPSGNGVIVPFRRAPTPGGSASARSSVEKDVIEEEDDEETGLLEGSQKEMVADIESKDHDSLRSVEKSLSPSPSLSWKSTEKVPSTSPSFKDSPTTSGSSGKKTPSPSGSERSRGSFSITPSASVSGSIRDKSSSLSRSGSLNSNCSDTSTAASIRSESSTPTPASTPSPPKTPTSDSLYVRPADIKDSREDSRAKRRRRTERSKSTVTFALESETDLPPRRALSSETVLANGPTGSTSTKPGQHMHGPLREDLLARLHRTHGGYEDAKVQTTKL